MNLNPHAWIWIDAQHQGALRRIEVEADDIGELRLEVGLVLNLKVSTRLGL